ncbi:MAG: PilZ domain-containing protein [Spirochaetaceae bacterium]|nr:MAG: PilZ domain-containing protein [Spirochaetaceae bacterium]
MKDEEWLEFTNNIINYPATKSTEIGVLTDANLNKKYLSRKYLIDIGITCGFISLIPNPKKLLKVILRILEANEAKGRRKHVRVHCTNADTFNFRRNTVLYRGDLVDISSAGILCQLPDESAKLIPGMVLDSIQLKLQGVLSMASGTVYGTRKATENSLHYLIMFDRENMSDKTKSNILSYICRRQADFINEASEEDAQSAPEFGEMKDGGKLLDNKSNDELTQELIEELQMVDTELEEIDDILKAKGGNVKKADP